MPKMKSHSGAAKRFSRTGTGKVKFKRAKLRHCLEAKHKVTKKGLSQTGYLDVTDVHRVTMMLPYDK